MSEEMIKYYYLCNNCGSCRQLCTIFRTNILEAFSPRTRMTLAGNLYLNKISITEKTKDVLFSCTLCGLCDDSCPSGVNVTDTIKATRKYIIEKGEGPGAISKLIDVIMKDKNIFSLENEDRMEWSSNIEEEVKPYINKNAELALFVGCQESFRGSLYNIPESLVKIFIKAGVDFTLLGEDEWCCGAPYFLLGLNDSDKAKTLMEHNVEKMKALGVKKIVTTCPGCYRTWKVDYKKLNKDLDFDIIHSTEILAELIKEGKIKARKEVKKKVVFQDPCEMGRHGGIYEQPRDILKSIPGVELIQLDREKADAYCCGGGGLCKASYPEKAVEIASGVIDTYKEAGGELIVTSCPACFDNLFTAIDERKKEINLLDIHEMLVELLE
ncbi:MAG: (Fe-S)-binding protein [Candidatus Helarchaeota archaeon]